MASSSSGMAAAGEEYELLMHVDIIPDELEGDTYCFSPCDLFENTAVLPMSWPVFFDYDIEGSAVYLAVKNLIQVYPLLMGYLRPSYMIRIAVVYNTPEGTAPGIPFYELQSDLTIAEAIQMLPAKIDQATFPYDYKVPFFMDTLDAFTSFKRRGPLTKVRLTHFKDGCCINLAIQHILCDEFRYVDIIRSLGMALRRLPLEEYYHSRKHFYPDMFARVFAHLGEKSPERRIRREVPDVPNEPIPYLQYKNDSAKVHVFHFTESCIDKMKAVVAPFLPQFEFVSTNDVLSAYFWMLQCELFSTKKKIDCVSDLEIDGTFFVFTFELVTGGYGWNRVLPHDRYSGNCFIFQYLGTEGLNIDSLSFEKCFSALALRNRRRVQRLKMEPKMITESLMYYFDTAHDKKATLPIPQEKIRALFFNLMKAPFKDINYGSGNPVWTYTLGSSLASHQFTVAPGAQNEGFNVYCVILGTQEKQLKNSIVRKTFAPEMKDIFEECSLEEIREMIAKKKEPVVEEKRGR